jgi:hypothetical protein
MRSILCSIVVASLIGCSGGSSTPCGGACKATEVCVEVNGVACAPACSQDAGTAETDAGVCPVNTTCQEAVTQFCDRQPCADTMADVCL